MAAFDRKAKKTDWTIYYSQKRSIFSSYTQKFTCDIIIQAMERYLYNKNIRVAELGGGNSCFAEKICKERSIDSYDIFDNNELAVNMFNKMNLMSKSHTGLVKDLLGTEAMDSAAGQYDFVFSIGLIEHFRGDDIMTIIDKHYQYCRKGGMVLIAFPTPTKRYIFTRRCMELVGAWQFYDEKPIRYNELRKIFEDRSVIKANFINKKQPLTQRVVITIKK